MRSYRLAYSAAMDLWLCTMLFLVRELQIVSLLVVYGAAGSNYDLLADVPNLKYAFQVARISILEFNVQLSSVSMTST